MLLVTDSNGLLKKKVEPRLFDLWTNQDQSPQIRNGGKYGVFPIQSI